MNDIQIFENEQFGRIRVIEKDGAPWFIGKDVAEALGYEAARNALATHVDDCDKLTHQISASGQNRDMTLINESGVYSLIFSSKLKSAKQFKRWVTSEVLPSIRKHGAYMTGETLEKALTNPDFIIRLATELKHEKEARAALETKVTEDAPKVAFADAIITSETAVSIRTLAKLITQNGVEIGQRRLFAWLRDNGYLIRGGVDKNQPTQKAAQMGLFEVRQSVVKFGRGGQWHTARTTRVTGKGQAYFINLFLHPENIAEHGHEPD